MIAVGAAKVLRLPAAATHALQADRASLWAMPALQCVLLAFFSVVAATHWPLYNMALLLPAFGAGKQGAVLGLVMRHQWLQYVDPCSIMLDPAHATTHPLPAIPLASI